MRLYFVQSHGSPTLRVVWVWHTDLDGGPAGEQPFLTTPHGVSTQNRPPWSDRITHTESRTSWLSLFASHNSATLELVVPDDPYVLRDARQLPSDLVIAHPWRIWADTVARGNTDAADALRTHLLGERDAGRSLLAVGDVEGLGQIFVTGLLLGSVHQG